MSSSEKMSQPDWQAKILLLKELQDKARRILGVSQHASDQEIRRAFRNACKQCHPDVNQAGEQDGRRFRLICCAYKFLTAGGPCDELQNFAASGREPGRCHYDLDNNWGYWCWWRETYFDGDG